MAADSNRVLRLVAEPLICGLVGGGLVASLAWVWPEGAGVILLPSERQAVVWELGLQGLVGSAVLGLILRRRRPGLAVAALLPALLLVLLSLAPTEGKLTIEVSEGVQGAVMAVGAGLAVLSLTRFAAPAAAAALLTLTGAVGVGLLQDGPVRGTASPGAPDVLLITVDTVRADHFDFLSGDGDKARTPNLSALAQRARVFDQAYAPMAITAPSHVTLFSGQSPREHGVRRNGLELPDDLPWLPERFAEAGYRTRAVVSAAVLESSLGFSRGFDTYDSQFEGGIEEDPKAARDRLVRGHGLLSWQGWRRRAGSAYHRSGWDSVELVRSLADAGETPTFTWVHLYDAHWPYLPSAEAREHLGIEPAAKLPSGLLPAFMGQQEPLDEDVLDLGRDLYRAGLEDVDAMVGEILETVRPNTVVIVTADHGESLGEHDYTFNHGKLPFAPDTRVPLLVSGPGVEAGRVGSPVPLSDVPHTVATLAGLPGETDFGEHSLLEPQADRLVVSASWSREFPQPVSEGEDLEAWAGIAARQGSHSAVVTRWHAAATYQRRTDLGELRPQVWSEERPEPAGLVDLRGAMRAQLALPVEGAAKEVSEMNEALQALGYMEPETEEGTP